MLKAPVYTLPVYQDSPLYVVEWRALGLQVVVLIVYSPLYNKGYLRACDMCPVVGGCLEMEACLVAEECQATANVVCSSRLL